MKYKKNLRAWNGAVQNSDEEEEEKEWPRL